MDTDSAESRDRFRQAIGYEIRPLEEYIIALKSHRNSVAPISRLPSEVLTSIFSFFSLSAWNQEVSPLAWIRVVNVCRRWRQIALNNPRLWTHIDFTKLTAAAMAEMLARAKTMPLHLEAGDTDLSVAWRDAFERQLEAHIFHTRHLSLSGHSLQPALDRLVSSAPTLESLSLSHLLYPPRRWSSHPQTQPPVVIIPANLFDSTAPSLTGLQLKKCDISWKSPLLKHLRTLDICELSEEARPELEVWLDALNEMPKLETLILQSATPLSSLDDPLISKPTRAVKLPFLTRFHLSASVNDGMLALAHLVLPSLTWFHVDTEYQEGEHVGVLIPYVARHASGLQDTEPFRSILISGDRRRSEVLAWTMPDADVEVCDSKTLLRASVSASFMFAATGTSNGWDQRMDTAIIDAIVTLLRTNSVSTLSVLNDTRLSKEFWLSHAPRLSLLEQARLIPTAVRAFRDMLAEDPPPNKPRLPSLTNLVLVDVELNGPKAYHLRDMVMERVEQGVPLEALDLRTCVAGDRSIQSLAEVVVEVQEPLAGPSMAMEEPASFDWHRGIRYWDQVEYYEIRNPWYYRYTDAFEAEGSFDE